MGLPEATDLARQHIDHVRGPRAGARGREIQGSCPFHASQKHQSFGLNIDTGLWNCFGGCGGGWIDTLLYRLGYSSQEVQGVLQGVIRPPKKSFKVERTLLDPQTGVRQDALPEYILKFFSMCPLSLLEEGWMEETLFTFEIGYDPGTGRVTYPIRDWDSNLVAISGRTLYSGVEPRYKIYTTDDLYEAAPEEYWPKRRELVFNIHRARWVKEGEKIAITEGFKEVMRLHEAGITAIALAGAEFTRQQLYLLNRLHFTTGCEFVIFFDNDTVGKQQAGYLCQKLMRFTHPRIVFTEQVKDVSEITDLAQVRNLVRRAPTYFKSLLGESL